MPGKDILQTSLAALAEFKGRSQGNRSAIAPHIDLVSLTLLDLRKLGDSPDEIDKLARTFIARLIELEQCDEAYIECWRLFSAIKARFESPKQPTLPSSPSLRAFVKGISFSPTTGTPRNVFLYVNTIVLLFQTAYLSLRQNRGLIPPSALISLLDSSSLFSNALLSQSPKLRLSSSQILVKVLTRILAVKVVPRPQKALMILRGIILTKYDIPEPTLALWLSSLTHEVQITTHDEPEKLYTYLRKDLFNALQLLSKSQDMDNGLLRQMATDFREFKAQKGMVDDYSWESVEERLSPPKHNPFTEMLLTVSRGIHINSGDVDAGFSSLSSSQLESDACLRTLLSAVRNSGIQEFPTYKRFVLRLLAALGDHFGQNEQDLILTRRTHLAILDAVTVQLRDIISDIDKYDFVCTALASLAETFKRCGQTKRYRNVSNLYYNLALRTMKTNPKDSVSNIAACLTIEHVIYLSEPISTNVEQYESKFQKCVALLQRCGELKAIMSAGSAFFGAVLSGPFSQALTLLRSRFSKTLNGFSRCVAADELFNFKLFPPYIRAALFCAILDTLKSAEVAKQLFLKLEIEDLGLLLFCGAWYLSVYDGAQLELSLPQEIISEDLEILEHKPVISISFQFWKFSRTKNSNFSELPILFDTFVEWLTRSDPVHSESSLFTELEWSLFISMSSLLSSWELHNYTLALITVYSEKRHDLIASDPLKKLAILELQTSQCLSIGISSSAYRNIKLIESLVKTVGLETKALKAHQFSLFLSKLEYYLLVGDSANADAISRFISAFVSSESVFRSQVSDYASSHFDPIDVDLVALLGRLSRLMAARKFAAGGFVECLFDLRRGVRLAFLVGRKLSLSGLKGPVLAQTKWKLCREICLLYRTFIDYCLHHGFSKDCEYYHKELMTFLNEQEALPIVKIKCGFSTALFAILALKEALARETNTQIQELYKQLLLCFDIPKEVSLLVCISGLLYNNSAFSDANSAMVYENYKQLCSIVESFHTSSKITFKPYTLLSDRDIDSFRGTQISVEECIISKITTLTQAKLAYLKTPFRPPTPVSHILLAKKGAMEARALLCADPVLAALPDLAIALPSTQEAYCEKRCSAAKLAEDALKNALSSLTELDSMALALLSAPQTHLLVYTLSLALSMLSAITPPIGVSFSPLRLTRSLCYVEESLRFAPFIKERLISSASENTNLLLPDLTIPKENDSGIATDQLFSRLLAVLPSTWSVVTIDFCAFSGDLLLGHLRAGATPFMIRLPVRRFSGRDVGESTMTLEDAAREFADIVEKNNALTRFSRDNKILDASAKRKWWKERYLLNARLELLLGDMQRTWVGGFRGLMSPGFRSVIPKSFVRRLGKIFCSIPSRRRIRNFEIDENVAALFLALGQGFETDALEDLIYFVLDTLSFRGEENAYDEVDIDQIYVDVEELLKQYKSMDDGHLVLVVGKSCQNIPWESLPCLEKRSVSRMPSIELLLDALDGRKGDRFAFSKTRMTGSCILNPGKDLKRTQDVFEERLKADLPTWKSLVGKPPSEEFFHSSLVDSDLFVYIGHGGGEHYIRNSKLKKIPSSTGKKCAAALLLGCSSGSLKDNGQLEPNGTVFSYLVAGAPMVLANLWDVTDKDIDRFSIAVFEKWGLFENESDKENQKFCGINEQNVTGRVAKRIISSGEGMNICEAVASSREVCLLRYLNGAAPVVYGLPYFLE